MTDLIKDERIPRPAFDHCYRTIQGDDVFKGLAARGFLLNPDPVIHPGRLKCQFLHFLSPENSIVYLEFIFRDKTLPKSFEGPEEEPMHAGFAMRVAEDLGQVFKRYESDHVGLKPNFVHRNYERTSDENAQLPGWNFLTFMNQPIDDTEVWLIEYERIPNRSELEILARRQQFMKMCEHPNSARRILGFLWRGQTLDDFSKFAEVSLAEVSDQKFFLEGGTFVRVVDESAALFEHFESKRGSFLAVVIGVDSFGTFAEVANPDDIFEMFGRQAARIKLDNASWDIVAVEV